MKNKLILCFNILLILGLLITSCDRSNDIVGIWEGGYTAYQGTTGLTLSVYNTGNQYEAVFEFYNLPKKENAKNGKYYMSVSYNELTKKYYLTGNEWIEQPSGYIFVDLEGKITKNVFSGSVIIPKYSLDTNPNTYREYYAKKSEETERFYNDPFTFRVVKKSKNLLRELIQKIF
jgi:hypothetical protein